MPTLSSISAISWHSVLRPEDMKNCVCMSNIEQSNLKFPQNILNKMGIHFHSGLLYILGLCFILMLFQLHA
jgi:hypothetical protein